MKKRSMAVLLVMFAAGALITDRSVNIGMPIGYHGDLNRLTAAFQSLPGVSVESVGYNSDVTLEEITFWIRNAEGFRRQINFGENEPIRALWGQRLEAALATRLAEPCNWPWCKML